MTTHYVLEIFIYVLAAVLVIGLCCVVCVYGAWFASNSYSAEKRIFEEIIGRNSCNEDASTESDYLLGRANV